MFLFGAQVCRRKFLLMFECIVIASDSISAIHIDGCLSMGIITILMATIVATTGVFIPIGESFTMHATKNGASIMAINKRTENRNATGVLLSQTMAATGTSIPIEKESANRIYSFY